MRCEPIAHASAERLPPRLDEVRALVRRGLSNKRIASEMRITEGTVKNYLTELFPRLGVSNRTQAAVWQPGVPAPHPTVDRREVPGGW